MKVSHIDVNGNEPLWNLGSTGREGDTASVDRPLVRPWAIGDVGHIPGTGENFMVTAVSGNTLTVIRNITNENLDYAEAVALIREVASAQEETPSP